MKKLLSYFGVVTTTIILAVSVFFAVALIWYAWELHPWVRTGRSVNLGHWNFGDFEFEAWQRKNASMFEPFSDELFIQHRTNQWQAVCFDIQDSFSPNVELKAQGSYVVVYRDGEERGIFDMRTGTFRWRQDNYAPAYINGAPPGD